MQSKAVDVTQMYMDKFRYGLDVVGLSPIQSVPGLEIVVDGEAIALNEFVNCEKMPIARFNHMLEVYPELSKKVSEKDAIDLANEIIKANNQGDRSMVGYLCGMLKDWAKLTPQTHYYQMASAFYLMPNEDPRTYDAVVCAKKIEAFKNLADKVFFWKKLSFHLKRLGIGSASDLQAKSNKAEMMQQIYRRTLKQIPQPEQ